MLAMGRVDKTSSSAVHAADCSRSLTKDDPPRVRVRPKDGSVKVFVVDVWVSGRHHVVERRYSEFEELHKQVKKMMKTREFPPKKVLKWNNKVLEQRRLGLESYLQGVVVYEAVPRAVLEFLQISLEDNGMDFENTSAPYAPKHQAVVTFTEDAYLQDVNRGTLPDIIAEGITIGLFDSDYYTAFPS
ncbi:hypothetical protein ACOMHN_018564 [Nucella lapillus]